MDEKRALMQDFNRAAALFWSLAEKLDKDEGNNDIKDRLMDAANDLFLGKDALAQSGLTSTGNRWTGIVFEEKDVRAYLDKKGIVMNMVPQTTSTGRLTYRVLNKPRRFD